MDTAGAGARSKGEKSAPVAAQRRSWRHRLGLIVVAGAIGGAVWLSVGMFWPDTSRGYVPAPGVPPVATPTRVPEPPLETEFGVAYGTEKELWLKWAIDEFARTPEGRNIRVTLIPLGTVEAAHAIVEGDTRIHVWAPASSLYEESFLQQWKVKRGESPAFVKQQLLALTPMVFVMWSKRYEAFKVKYGELSFGSIAQAIEAEGGWGTIAQKPEWGLFKFGHTHPNRSNSGLMTLLLMAYDFHHKTAGLSPADVVMPKFQEFMGRVERGVSSLPSSTGYLIKEMVLKGPSAFDALMLYESVAIERIENAAGRWDDLRILYPRVNIWSNHPYYILAAPWCAAKHHKAAERFMEFLLAEPAQRRALEHGYRPANERVPIKFPESPFTKYAKYGLQIDLPAMSEFPKPEVLDNLQQAWLRASGSR